MRVHKLNAINWSVLLFGLIKNNVAGLIWVLSCWIHFNFLISSLFTWKTSQNVIFETFSFLPYKVSEIQCSFATTSSSTADMITARLKKPVGFKGSPLFADDRGVHPDTDRACSIRSDSNEPDNIAYTLKITDFSRCGVLKRNVRNTSCWLFVFRPHRLT